jgi:hypothetical protein
MDIGRRSPIICHVPPNGFIRSDEAQAIIPSIKLTRSGKTGMVMQILT